MEDYKFGNRSISLTIYTWYKDKKPYHYLRMCYLDKPPFQHGIQIGNTFDTYEKAEAYKQTVVDYLELKVENLKQPEKISAKMKALFAKQEGFEDWNKMIDSAVNLQTNDVSILMARFGQFCLNNS